MKSYKPGMRGLTSLPFFIMNKADAWEVRLQGIQNEYIVKRYLQDVLKVTVRDPSEFEDKREDIDAWVVSRDGKHTSVSIKVNEPKYYTAPFVFEKSIGWYDRKGNVVDTPSWFYKGKAMAYLVWKRDTPTTGTLWHIDAARLKQYVEREGFDYDVESSGVSKEREVYEGKAYTHLGLVHQETLEDIGIAKRVGVIKDARARKYRSEWWKNEKRKYTKNRR